MPAADETSITPTLLARVTDEIATGSSPTVSSLFSARGAPAPEIIPNPSEDVLKESRLVTLFRHWHAMDRVDGQIPHQDRLDPIDIASALSIVMLLEVEEGGEDYRYLIYGEEIAERFGHHMVGKRTSEIPIPPSVSVLFLGTYRAVIRTRVPFLTEHAPPPEVSVTTWRRLILPLCDDTGAVSRLLVGNLPGNWRKAE